MAARNIRYQEIKSRWLISIQENVFVSGETDSGFILLNFNRSEIMRGGVVRVDFSFYFLTTAARALK